jgi:hypothetical protein
MINMFFGLRILIYFNILKLFFDIVLYINLLLSNETIESIERHLKTIPLAH